MTIIKKVYRVKALDTNYVSCWNNSKEKCESFIKAIPNTAGARYFFGTQHVIEEINIFIN